MIPERVERCENWRRKRRIIWADIWSKLQRARSTVLMHFEAKSARVPHGVWLGGKIKQGGGKTSKNSPKPFAYWVPFHEIRCLYILNRDRCETGSRKWGLWRWFCRSFNHRLDAGLAASILCRRPPIFFPLWISPIHHPCSRNRCLWLNHRKTFTMHKDDDPVFCLFSPPYEIKRAILENGWMTLAI